MDIQNERAYAASDASVKDGIMAGSWHIKNDENELLLSNLIYYKDWNDNNLIGSKAITLLELIETIERKGRNITSRKIEIAFDNRISYRRIVEEIAKLIVYSKDAGAEIAKIKKIIERSPFKIKLHLVKEHEAPKRTYQQQPL